MGELKNQEILFGKLKIIKFILKILKIAVL
jgi:hypothetical protein